VLNITGIYGIILEHLRILNIYCMLKNIWMASNSGNSVIWIISGRAIDLCAYDSPGGVREDNTIKRHS
jgi:hypothetical protein